MYFILETNPDPMGGGAYYIYVTYTHSLEEAKLYVEQHKGAWRSFVISKKCDES